MSTPIAIVGRGCVLPGALDPAALWELVLEGRDVVGPAPEGRWRLSAARALTTDPRRSSDRAYSDHGGYVRGLDERFDPSGFAVDAALVAAADPALRWALHAAREALREARVDPPADRAGVVLGNLSFPTASHAALVERHHLGAHPALSRLLPEIDPRERFHSSRVAALTARALGLSGAPAFCIDAACASSLYAIALACDALRDGRADLMVAGAVNCTDDLFIHVGFSALDALSKTGRSRPFHPEADGLVPAEGAAVVALMRLEDARARGCPVLGVIRGVGLANDGRAKSFLAPAEEGQVRAMRAAYASAGLSPADVGWIECHATGTPLGDATEARSTARVFEGCDDVPIGSLKANLGHLITSAGAAGLLKVLGAFRAGVRPPTPHLDRVTPALAGTPLRLVTQPEPWDAPIRRAAVSAFGFGGNDAHLIVEEDAPAVARVDVPARLVSREPLAIVGIGLRVGPFGSARAFADALSTGEGGRRAREVVLPLEALRSPPADLAAALGQQTMLLAAALDARVDGLDPERTAVLVGMQCDSEVARYGVRWRLPELAERAGLDVTELEGWRESFAPRLEAAGVLGTMPNIPANRLNRELDLRGPSYTVSEDECSGVRALAIAARALRARELDAAVVGAVELGCEPVHEAAARAVLPPLLARGGDAAVVLVLERLDDARAKGRAVLAIVGDVDDVDDVDPDGPVDDGALRLGPRVPGGSLAPRFGHAHAASGLLHVAAAALCLHRRIRPWEGAWASDGVRAARVDVESVEGARAVVTLSEDPQTPAGAVSLASVPAKHPLRLRAHPPVPRPVDAALPSAPALPASEHRVVSTPLTDGEAVMEPAPGWVTGPRARPVEAIPDAIPSAAPNAIPAAASLELVAALQARQQEIATLHTELLRTQTELHTRFVLAQERALRTLMGVARPSELAIEPAAEPATEPAPPTERAGALRSAMEPAPPSPPPNGAARATKRRGLTPATPPPAPAGRSFTRAELEVHASGSISSIFGPELSAQDEHAVQVRMPQPPLLLADRATGLTGDIASMGKGTVWTETDVTPDAWYLECGRMPPGLMIESGQADLLLISYLGADLFNRGERAYRLLGCQLTWHRSPPRVGETLAYDIHIDGHAQQGAQRLFFFHYDCHIDGAPALTVRSGQAGFFTKEELAESAGVLWSPEEHELAADARVDPPAVRCTKRALESAELEALSEGDVVACFGPGYERTLAHVRTPRIAGGRMRWLERVTDLDPEGGPWRRGYLKAVTPIRPDDWYFAGHFKNDPCMPGTLMFEGCLSAMALYLVGLGYTLDRDGWRFEPIPDETYTMVCRGQVTPSSKELTYEVFVEEVHDGPVPKLYADLLCTVDGRKAFHARRMGVQLVPDWPLTSEPAVAPDRAPVATLDGVPLGRAALLASAWGPPSMAFGPRYAEFDGVRRAPRLPGPPYHLVSRVLRVDGAPWTKQAGASVEIAYDVPPDAWYFADGASGAMPYALLLEAALQPCGWLATYVGSTLGHSEDLRFRNLDGEGEVLAEVAPDAGTLVTRATLTRLTDTASMVIVGFDVVTRAGERDVYRLKTQFGFFPDAAFRDQAGLPVSEAQRALLLAEDAGIDLARVARHLPSGRLALLDAIPFFDPRGGRAGLGAARGEARVDPSAWFFRAHFFQDPVQPGSLGMEAMLSLLRAVMLELGLAEGAVRFEPIATRPHRWKYRGQVLPTDGRVAVTLEVTELERAEGRVVASADASFWIDGKRIYEATIGAAMVLGPLDGLGGERDGRLCGAQAELPGPRAARWPLDARLDTDDVARFWREQLGVGPSMAEDLYLAALRRFVRHVHADPALARIEGRPALYLANHQTAIETLTLSIVAGACAGVPVITLAKREHRDSWLGALLAWIFAHPLVGEPELTAYFDRDDPSSLPGLLRSLRRDRGLLIHAEGTRATRAGARLAPTSGVPIDLALERDLPIVPVRFTGGLPLEPVARKLDFPVAMGAQDLWLGAPIAAEELRPLPYKERVERVRAAIEALGPVDEAPGAPDLAFASAVARWMERHRVDLPHAVLGCLLFESESPSALTERVRAGEPLDDRQRDDPELEDPEQAWASTLVARLGIAPRRLP